MAVRLLHVSVTLYMCVYILMRPKVHMYVCLQKLKINSLLYSNHLPSYFSGNKSQRFSCLYLPSAGITDMHCCLAFHMDPKDLNSAPHGNMESNFPTKSFP